MTHTEMQAAIELLGLKPPEMAKLLHVSERMMYYYIDDRPDVRREIPEKVSDLALFMVAHPKRRWPNSFSHAMKISTARI